MWFCNFSVCLKYTVKYVSFQRDLDNKLWAKKKIDFVRENFVYLLCAVASKRWGLETLLSCSTLLFSLNWTTWIISNVNSFLFFTLLGISCVNCAVLVRCQICKNQDSINKNPKFASFCDSKVIPGGQLPRLPAAWFNITSRGRAATLSGLTTTALTQGWQ